MCDELCSPFQVPFIPLLCPVCQFKLIRKIDGWHCLRCGRHIYIDPV